MNVALVNNMPDAAFVDTEEQFRSLTTFPAGVDTVDLALYTITEIPRSEAVAAVIRSRYRGLDELWTHVPDALIVTGTEPTQTQLPNEPHWPYLARVLEWAASSVPTTMLSCLAAHASVLLFDAIERVPRRVKCSGVYYGSIGDPSDPLAKGLPQAVRFPHSRMNDVPEAALLDAGYRIIVGDGEAGAGWAVAARDLNGCLFVLCQGHPEYATLSLLREYRRDVRRHLFSGGALAYPRLPEGYLSPEAVDALTDFGPRAASSGMKAEELWASFPYDDVASSVQNTWAAAAKRLYANWLGLAGAPDRPRL